MKELKKRLEKSILEYIKFFEKKHKVEFDYWVADRTGEIAVFGDYFLNFGDIRLDLENDVSERIMFEWYDLSLNAALIEKEFPNYQTYLKRHYSYLDRV